jgi:hypothetical protein
LRELVAKIPPERMSKREIGFGEATLTASELVAKAEEAFKKGEGKGSEQGNQFLDAIYTIKNECPKRRA